MSKKKRFKEPAKTLKVLAETEVLVAGGGPSGLAAAIAASREGVETMLVEKNGYFGGNITKAHVEAFHWYRKSQAEIEEEVVEAGGVGREFEKCTQEMGELQNYPRGDSKLLDADLFKLASDKMVQEASITPIFHCMIVDSIVENGGIKGVITESKSGRQVILADRVIDATGDADIIARAGVPYQKAETEDLMPVTVGFGMRGVDVDKFENYVSENPTYISDWAPRTKGKEDNLFHPFLGEVFDKAKRNGDIPEGTEMQAFWHSLTKENEATGLNITRIFAIDPTNVWDLTKAELEGRKQVRLAEKVLKKYAPGFENSRIRTIAPEVGTRESRTIEGQYKLVKEDVMNQATFNDSIGVYPEFLDGAGWVVIPTSGRYFQIPYRIMVPKEVDNLLVAGRSVSGDRVSHAATRQMSCCAVTGQGAGVAAATSLKDGTTTSNVNISKVQDNLQKQGVRVK